MTDLIGLEFDGPNEQISQDMLYFNVSCTFIISSTSQYPIILYLIVLSCYSVFHHVFICKLRFHLCFIPMLHLRVYYICQLKTSYLLTYLLTSSWRSRFSLFFRVCRALE